MAGKGRVVGMGGGFWRGGQLQDSSSGISSLSLCDVDSVASTLCVVMAASQEGNDCGMIPSSLHASIDMKNLSVASEIYTTWRVVLGCLNLVKRVMRNARAPLILIASWFAAFIFIVVGVRWDVLRPS